MVNEKPTDGDRFKDHKGRTFTVIRAGELVWADYDDGNKEGPFPATEFGGPDGGEVQRVEPNDQT
jgi:hypothetical protein